jgi:hypothetical protein
MRWWTTLLMRKKLIYTLSLISGSSIILKPRRNQYRPKHTSEFLTSLVSTNKGSKRKTEKKTNQTVPFYNYSLVRYATSRDPRGSTGAFTASQLRDSCSGAFTASQLRDSCSYSPLPQLYVEVLVTVSTLLKTQRKLPT